MWDQRKRDGKFADEIKWKFYSIFFCLSSFSCSLSHWVTSTGRHIHPYCPDIRSFYRQVMWNLCIQGSHRCLITRRWAGSIHHPFFFRIITEETFGRIFFRLARRRFALMVNFNKPTMKYHWELFYNFGNIISIDVQLCCILFSFSPPAIAPSFFTSPLSLTPTIFPCKVEKSIKLTYDAGA